MSDINRKIYQEQIRLIYGQGTGLAAASTLCAVCITLFLWRHFQHPQLILWLAAVGLSTALRLIGIYLYLNAQPQVRELPRWGTLYWLGSLVTGSIWGVWPLFFYNLYTPEYLLMMSTVFAGMVAMSAAAGSIYFPAFLSFSVPLLIPMSITHLLSGRDSLAIVGVLLLLFLGVNWMLAIRCNRNYQELILSKLENLKLIDRLAEEKRIAERAMVAKSRFLAAASHDLRQPLHAMGLFLSALRKREEDPQNKCIVEDMTKSAEALNSLFNSLLDVSRLDAEIIEFNPVHVPASRLFDALRAQFVQQAAEKNLHLNITTDSQILYCDVVLLERVLRNLLSNAVQYTNSGSISLYCTQHSNDTIRITLMDTGLGIPEEFTEDVFSEYYQVNNPERDRNKGLGLGLSIVRRLCELMGVPLHMESEEGEGTVFMLDVPRGKASNIVEQARPAAEALAVNSCVLVIDDEVQVLQSMRHMLEGWGCEVMLAESARDAIRVVALSDSIPDILITDYRLSGDSTGIDAVASIRVALECLVPAIIVTGDTSPERLKEVKDTGLQLLHKPVHPDELREVVQMLLMKRDTFAATLSATR